ncbi:hypoxanthine phosphoribosyltransferase [Natranaerobius thermophilus]|uniref:Hypoxanthine phosphoribosyltransferase n=1 Tax=Natranaerobius thermophilus (strain ATCC BAA-1301 / DSM 18059 / JW/NM-WN-LF) TaxID=457570 RepID=B2A3Q3_NATTJ|nr:hypoxanthine phosphoribosyltransferase [Natranaerobius thermophilus]ACB83679.1 hypoxanthine phosphoribosyltransferase [Natranaerobius thermophilus JW/NM-WN-LF]
MERAYDKDAFKQLISEEEIKDKVKELGEQISQDYQGQEVIAVGVLKGSFVFAADLLRQLSIPNEIDFLAVSSYGASTKSSGIIRILKDLDTSIENKHVLIVEDIVDTGLTLNYLLETLSTRKPASLKICTLLDKPDRREVDLTPDYIGFQIPDLFVVGYGLDYAEYYRDWPAIYVLPEEDE